MAEGKFWFKHDNNADDDPKLIRVFLKLGHEGKSVFWSIIQMLHKADGYLSLADCDSIAHKCSTSPDVVTSLIKDFDLFKMDDTRFWNARVLGDILERLETSKKNTANVRKRWDGKNDRNTTVEPPNNDRNTFVILEDRSKKIEDRTKEIDNSCGTADADATGLNDASGSKGKKFKPPTQEEVTQYFTERQGGKWTPEDIARQAIKWFERYTSNGWTVGRAKMKDWKAAVRTWISNDYDECSKRFSESTTAPGFEKRPMVF